MSPSSSRFWGQDLLGASLDMSDDVTIRFDRQDLLTCEGTTFLAGAH